MKAKERRKLCTLPETLRMLLSKKLAEEHAMIDGKEDLVHAAASS